LADGAFAAPGEHHAVPPQLLDHFVEVVDGAAFLLTAQVRVADHPTQPPVTLQLPGEHEQVLTLRITHTVLRTGQAQ
jgi:hypothetical protein